MRQFHEHLRIVGNIFQTRRNSTLQLRRRSPDSFDLAGERNVDRTIPINDLIWQNRHPSVGRSGFRISRLRNAEQRCRGCLPYRYLDRVAHPELLAKTQVTSE